MKRKIRIKVGDVELEIEGFTGIDGIGDMIKLMSEIKNEQKRKTAK